MLNIAMMEVVKRDFIEFNIDGIKFEFEDLTIKDDGDIYIPPICSFFLEVLK